MYVLWAVGLGDCLGFVRACKARQLAVDFRFEGLFCAIPVWAWEGKWRGRGNALISCLRVKLPGLLFLVAFGGLFRVIESDVSACLGTVLFMLCVVGVVVDCLIWTNRPNHLTRMHAQARGRYNQM